MARKKHIPQRMCVACRESQAKKSLVRLVRTPDGVKVDPTGKLAGRGAYLHLEPDCWQKGLGKPLEKALRVSLAGDEINRMQEELVLLSDTQNPGQR